MKNKKLIIGLVILVSIIGVIVFLNNNNGYDGKLFKLDDKYYNNGTFIDISSNEVNELLKNKSTFILFTYNDYCSLPVPCENIFKDAMKNYNVDVLQIIFREFKDTKLYKNIKYAPSIIIIKDGVVVDYLDSNKDEDLPKYQDIDEFSSWISKYIILKQ